MKGEYVMKKFLIIGMIVLGFGMFASSTVQSSRAIGKCTAEQVQKGGCCSRHGGVCGCNTDKHLMKCCDGTLSKSCGC